ncbi:MAG TPA: tripartite tricarboxylate transporter substrate binding protein [Usitatibacter sp.]|jgi:tripartite-type tricarboxylate transporter receptor subunit TctC|nr:tripartite tricarboxylate transporter substrate binding protein [Usitatibacter sp.]
MIRRLAAIAAALALPLLAAAQWPAQPVKIVVPFSPGTGMDILARTVQPRLSEMWHQPVIVENKPGASGNVGANQVAKAAPDGYTLVMGASTLVINTALYANLPYDPLTDLAPVGLAANASLLLVANPKTGLRSAQELIARAKESPGKMVYASPGIATPHHLAMELLKNRAGIDIVHVPFSATGPALTQLLGGEVPLMFLPVHVAIAHVQAGRLTALAMGGAKRSPLLPGVPTLGELGLRDADTDIWYAMWAPARTPPAIIAKIDADLGHALAAPDVRETLARQGMEVTTSTPAALAEREKAEAARWAHIVKAAGIKAE